MPASKVKRPQNLPNKKVSKKKFFGRHHGFLAIIVICGYLVPPLAILVRFGVGIDFFINIILTIAGYFPGHIHNFYCQNIRNNKGRGRTPKWALKTGLVQDDTEYVKSTRQWGNRYAERNTRNIYDETSHPYEDEYGNAIAHNHTGEDPIPADGFIERHGLHPSQPAGGLGEHGNDLLEGLPDEDAERRRRRRKDQKREYGSGLRDQDDYEDEIRRGDNNDSDSRRNGGGLLDDLDDHDRALYGGSSSRNRDSTNGRPEPSRNDSTGSFGLGSRKKGGKSGRAKKSERYGLAEDHRDVGVYGSGRAPNSIAQRKQQERDRAEFASNNPYSSSAASATSPRNNDRYDVRNSEDSRRKPTANGDEDFLNHQF